ncbi:uncharacterized protein LOC132038584 [Lycium ferocissimum]|uniref:uncharacterized protein LOC132038584 n=1 Tax=Lycium ferocissimum TaxID=112874 RepID=UPI0028155F50|nr:uncharacterized protein LOC132038584 [Lycium ferocissimum]
MDAVIGLIHELVDPKLEIPENYYKAKRLVSKLGLLSMRIDCCENGCMLYYKGDNGLECCKFCGRPRFKRTRSGKRVAVKAMHYLPLTPRLKRLYASNSSAPHMRWHSENRRPPGVMCHPSDGEAWKHFDATYPDFAGVETFDVSLKQNFNLRATLMWTINDFPAYGMLSGWMTAGKLACPYCMENTKSFTLKHGRKNSWFDCHRQFLPMDHEFRSMKNAFRKNTIEQNYPPPRLSGEEIWERVENLPKVTEEPPYKFDGYGVSHNWTKQSIFWELPYWKDNLLRHNLDVMHIEKNYFDNLFNTVMDVKGKTKDNPKARLDVQEYCRRRELWLQDKRNGVFKPKASYSFTMDQKRKICEWVENLKMPDGYASNLEKRVDMAQGRLHGMKSHDCHVFMETLLPIAFSGLPTRIWKPMTEISLFFKDLCSSTLRVDNLERMHLNIPVITSKLEKILPPGFFDVMEHLPIHLAEEAQLGGPVHCRWMYPFESYFVHLNGVEKVYDQFGKWFNDYVYNTEYGYHDQLLKDISWGPGLVYSMDKYVVNGFKFTTEERSKHMKTNNSGVWVKGGDGNQAGVDYYGVIKEILELEYSGGGKKSIVLFRCKWFDPTANRGTRVLKQYNIIEVNHTREYAAYDPFIIAQNVRQVYYAPYPLRPDKSAWWVVIKVKPVGRVEVENVLPVAFQADDISIVHQTVDNELEDDLEHAEHILEEINTEEINAEVNECDNEDETTDEEEWSEEGDGDED